MNLSRTKLAIRSGATMVPVAPHRTTALFKADTASDALILESNEYLTILFDHTSLIAQRYRLPSFVGFSVIVPQPQLVRGLCGELAVHEMAADRRSGFSVQAALLRDTDQMRSCEHNRATRFSHAVIPRSGSSSAMKR
jgi:hypothetical protein